MRDYVSIQAHKHGPVQQGDCNACHNPHGSENYKILKKYFPEEFYISYAEGNYAMCFECHNSQVAKDSNTTTLTDFRNKDVNPGIRTSTCIICTSIKRSRAAAVKHAIRRTPPTRKSMSGFRCPSAK
jgi:predicted CXXCH cytochrome family protein